MQIKRVVVSAALVFCVTTVFACVFVERLAYQACVAAEVAQQPIRWEGACIRCGEPYQWFGAQRPIQNRCHKCQGAIIWTPVYQ